MNLSEFYTGNQPPTRHHPPVGANGPRWRPLPWDIPPGVTLQPRRLPAKRRHHRLARSLRGGAR